VLKMTKTTAAAAVGGEDVGGEDVVGEEGDEVDHGADDDHGHGTTTTTTSLIGYNRRIADPKGVVLVCPGLESGEKRLTRLAFAQGERSDIQVLHVEKSVTGDVSILRRETIEEIVEDLVRGGYLETRGGGSDGKVSDERVGSGVAATSHLAARCPRTPPGYSPLATRHSLRLSLRSTTPFSRPPCRVWSWAGRTEPSWGSRYAGFSWTSIRTARLVSFRFACRPQRGWESAVR
jgi:hypothetical protein